MKNNKKKTFNPVDMVHNALASGIKRKIVTDYADGYSIATLASWYNLSGTKIRSVLKEAKVRLRKRWEWGIKELPGIESIRTDYLMDVPIKDIASRYGVDRRTIIRRLKWIGTYKVERRAHNKRNINLRKVKSLLRKRGNFKEIALLMGVGYMTLWRFKKKKLKSLIVPKEKKIQKRK